MAQSSVVAAASTFTLIRSHPLIMKGSTIGLIICLLLLLLSASFLALISNQPAHVHDHVHDHHDQDSPLDPHHSVSDQRFNLVARSAAQHGHSLHKHRKLGIHTQISQLLETVCNHTLYPDVCLHELSAFNIPTTASPSDIVSFSAQAAASRATYAQNLAVSLVNPGPPLDLEGQCADDCADLIEYARDRLDESMSRLSSIKADLDLSSLPAFLRDVKVWLSQAMSYQSACSDGLTLVPGSNTQQSIQSTLEGLSETIGNVLSLVDILAEAGDNLSSWLPGSLPPIPPLVHLRRRRSLLSMVSGDGSAGQSVPSGALVPDPESELSFPDWLSGAAERRLLQADTPVQSIPINAVVAQDGSGNYANVSDAIAGIPSGYQGRYVIYIKAGLYNEVFNITKSLQNITFLGDGMDKTVISGDRNVASGLFNTYRTSTVGISGQGFHARDISFRNVAGPAGHQAVALRAGADLLVFYRCSFESYQDTLYALSGRQLYRECRIYGTVDFIFGNAIAVFQSCELVARLPLAEQTNTVTAQGRKVLADVSGFSFQNCNIHADDSLGSAVASGTTSVHTYLGRPWKAYSRVVFMNSQISSVVDPAGWAPWNSSYPFIDTLYYGEFQNYGPGANTSSRVSWPGVHPSLTPEEAAQFSFDNFIAGSTWVSPDEAGFSS